ncbi:phage holin [Streptococcus suis]|uniref:phage holin n=1 Tax=Streptococcus suis TaxID=1307 RepID=UPI000DC77A9A|nr:phage holin [Streptococcus suis]AWX97033.1 phage holin [Streptococcus suis]HEM3544386.1 phage holin [Streptococcus suis]
MNLQEMILTALSTLSGIVIITIVKMVKEYLLRKGGAAAVRTLEIVASHAVQAVEQLAKDPKVELHGEQKLELAKEKVRDELTKYNFYFTDEQLNTFIEAAVHSMNSAWKGE